MTWRTQAACKNVPTRIFYPEKGSNADAAKLVCERCPVKAQCAAAGQDEAHGIWGGQSPLERGGLHNRGQKHRHWEVAACPVCDVRFWTGRTIATHGVRCESCRMEDAAA